MKIDTILLMLLVALGCAAVYLLYKIGDGLKGLSEGSSELIAKAAQQMVEAQLKGMEQMLRGANS